MLLFTISQSLLFTNKNDKLYFFFNAVTILKLYNFAGKTSKRYIARTNSNVLIFAKRSSITILARFVKLMRLNYSLSTRDLRLERATWKRRASRFNCSPRTRASCHFQERRIISNTESSTRSSLNHIRNPTFYSLA